MSRAPGAGETFTGSRAIAALLTVPVPPLVTGEDIKPKEQVRWSLTAPSGRLPATEVKRVAVVSSFSIGTWSAVDAFDFRKNACASQQEREFLRAVRQFFPSLQAYPNMPLRNFIDIAKLEAAVPARVRNYAWSAQVDVLLCTADEDPVAGIELDSIHRDTEEAAERDQLKNTLFKLAGLSLVRIRADDEKAVRAEDFYDLLMAESKALDALRPRRLRPRRTHDFLVPAESASSSRSTSAWRRPMPVTTEVGVFWVQNPEVKEVLDRRTGAHLRHDQAIGTDYEGVIKLRSVLQAGIQQDEPLYACAMCGVQVYLVPPAEHSNTCRAGSGESLGERRLKTHRD